jgi:Replication-relaxation
VSGPIASPIASSSVRPISRTGATSWQLSAAKVSPPARLSRITGHQLLEIAGCLTDQDWRVLAFLSASRLATGKQLVSCLWNVDRGSAPSQARIARRALKRLADWRVLDALPGRAVGGLHGGSDTLVYGVGTAGVRLLARRGQHHRRLGTPGARYVAHTLACTQLVVDLHVLAAGGELELIEVQQEPGCWRTFMGAMGARLILKPDLFVRVAIPGGAFEYRWMVEVDMATEATGTIRAKAARYLAHYRAAGEPVHPRVLWAVPDARRGEQIEGALHRLPDPAARLFSICLLDEVARFLATEARS